ncbi:HesA/MoeB/ThiF family protein [Flagellimonas meridianipacifica]|uniref:Molybdopterin-synthase adenylyltransferase n=1 Tax=Flagellimonas meridianipacifica TaxID=1080225 RepID=A0A2T0MBY1_9FLAO|nr:HesA/MoeB/ThiF family protein [Allomuricauda pacifica]PRX55001.1 adenylyltransferase/sulfurtransferase [Allomuricauda pacifica]
MDRYTRQTSLSDFGEVGQQKLSEAKVLVVGLGGLGLPALQYLNAMGVGTLGLIDQDIVDYHNLQRQILYTEKDVGKSKLNTAHNKLQSQNSETNFILHDTFLTRNNALEIIKEYDLVLDATDNFPTRYLINDACVVLNKPFVYGALHGFEGHVSVFNFKGGPTYRCLYPEMPTVEEIPNCDENGVLGVTPGIIGNLQALEAIKVVTGIGKVLSGKLLVFDGLHQNYLKIAFKTHPENLAIKELRETYESSGCSIINSISAQDFSQKRLNKSQIVLDVRTPKEFEHNHLAESINVPLQELELPFNLIESKAPIYVICQSGKRSELAIEQLQKAHPELTFCNILGGMNRLSILTQ